MAVFFHNHYPYTDAHELNLDWIIARLKELKDAILISKTSAESAAADAQSASESATSAAESAADARQYADSIDPEQILATANEYADQAAQDYTDEALDRYSPYKLSAGFVKLFDLNAVSATAQGYSVQGCVKVGKFIFGCDLTENRILRYNTENNTTDVVASFASGTYGHMNDCTYDGSYLYIAPGPTEVGKIYKFSVNETSGAMGSAIEVDVPNGLNIWNLCYDWDNQLFYSVTSDFGNLFSFTISGDQATIIDEIAYDFWGEWPDVLRQTLECRDGKLYALTGSNEVEPYASYVTVFKLDEDSVDYETRIELPRVLGEPEALFYDRENDLMLCMCAISGYTGGNPWINTCFAVDYKGVYEKEDVDGLSAYTTKPYNELTGLAATMANQSNVQYSTKDAYAKLAQEWYGDTLDLYIAPAGHGLLMFNQNLYLVTISGNPPMVLIDKIFGAGTQTITVDSWDASARHLVLKTSTAGLFSLLYTNGFKVVE